MKPAIVPDKTSDVADFENIKTIKEETIKEKVRIFIFLVALN